MTQYANPPRPTHPATAGGLAITALVLAIISLLLSIVVIGGLLGAVTLILAIVAWVMAAKDPLRTKGVAIAATIISALAVLVAVGIFAVGAIFAGPYIQKGKAVAPALQTGGQASTAAENAGADSASVSRAMQTFTETVGTAVRDAATPDEAKQAADDALADLEAKLQALQDQAAEKDAASPATQP